MFLPIYNIIGILPILYVNFRLFLYKIPKNPKIYITDYDYGLEKMQKQKIGIAYNEDYNKYDLGIDHPLIGNKPKKTMELLQEKKILENIQTFIPDKATDEDLLRVHTTDYIERIKQLSKTGGMLFSDTPAPIGIYDIARLATGGTILSGEKLFHNFQIMINPLAGFHHASKNFGSGFCFFNDIAIMIEYLRNKYKIKRFQIIDLDVHHGNGTQDIYYYDPSVLNISFHQDGRTLYPGTGFSDKTGRDEGEGYTVNLPLPPGTGEKEYLDAYEQIIPPLTKQFKPEIIIYQSGVDTHHSDPLADLNLTYQTYYTLARKINELSNKSCKKLAVLFGGGYNSRSSVKSYYNVVCGLLNKNDFIKEKEIMENQTDDVKERVEYLIKNLSSYWSF